MKRALIIVVSVVLVLTLSNCNNQKEYLDWQFINEETNFEEISILVEGIRYNEYIYSGWKPTDRDLKRKVGRHIYYFVKDVNRIFIYYDKPFVESDEMFFIREDIELPLINYNTIDSIGFKFPAYYSIDENTYYNSIMASQGTESIFECLEDEELLNYSYYKDARQIARVGEIVFYSDKLEGIEVSYELCVMGDKYYINTRGYEHYAEISRELLSKVIGMNIPLAKDFVILTIEEIYDFYGVEFK